MPETNSGGDVNSSAGQTANNFLEKIKPKDLVMFSPQARSIIAKNDFHYLDTDYDVLLETREEQSKIRIWGLPYLPPWHPAMVGTLSGVAIGCIMNALRRRPKFSSKRMNNNNNNNNNDRVESI